MQIPLPDQLLGVNDAHVLPLAPEAAFGSVRLHPATAVAFMALRADAARDGLDLRVVSGFRGFDRQLLIWNAKASGERVLLDDQERELDALRLPAEQRMLAILRWSALPGASRHHWGSDLDVVDASALAPGSGPALRAADYAPGGSQERLGRWLELNVDREPQSVFFRPYDGSGNGVAREPWHLSHAPLAARCQTSIDSVRLRKLLAGSGIALWEVVDATLDGLLTRFAHTDAMRYPAAWRHLLTGVRVA